MDPEATLKHAYACYKSGDLQGARECVNWFLNWRRANNGVCRWEADALAYLLNEALASRE